jgi:hypothetical protein
VRMRRRKPCTLCRRRLFGWYVRLLTSQLFLQRTRSGHSSSSGARDSAHGATGVGDPLPMGAQGPQEVRHTVRLVEEQGQFDHGPPHFTPTTCGEPVAGA